MPFLIFSGSTFPKCGSQDPDPDPSQNEMDSKRCLVFKAYLAIWARPTRCSSVRSKSSFCNLRNKTFEEGWQFLFVIYLLKYHGGTKINS